MTGSRPPLDAVILAGGGSTRMGESKASQLWGGVTAVERVADLARSIGARRIVTSGPVDFGYPFVPDPAPLSGPVAGILASLTRLGLDLGRVVFFAVDAPTARAADLDPLLSAPAPGATYEGLPLPMVLAPAAGLPPAPDDWPVKRLAEHWGLARLQPSADARRRLRGANTPEERAQLLAEAGWA